MPKRAKVLDRTDGIRTVWLVKQCSLFGDGKWYCRFSKEGHRLGPLEFFDAEHKNRFTAYRMALDKAIKAYVPNPFLGTNIK